MPIQPDRLFELVPRHLRSDFHPGSAVDRIQRFYCPVMVRQNNCTKNCKNCAPNLITIFEDVLHWNEPRDLNACLVYAIRRHLADMADSSLISSAELHTNWLGEPVEANPFELAVDEL